MLVGRRAVLRCSSRWLLQHRVTDLNAQPTSITAITCRLASSSNARWLARQTRDPYTRATKVSALKSRAAFKLLEIDQKHHLFQPGQTVVDLGYAPGSWSQIAISRVRGKSGNGRVIGIDVIPAQPPRGVSTIQGNFLNPDTRQQVVDYIRDVQAGRPRASQSFARHERDEEEDGEVEDESIEDQAQSELAAHDEAAGRLVDVVLSDMSEPWPLVNTWVNSVINPYRRMMNTSGNSFKDHAGSMDLCMAALQFSYDTLKTGGSFLCKYYQGAEDKQFEKRLRALFDRVHRIKPDSSRKESREAYFLALQRRSDASKEQVFTDT